MGVLTAEVVPSMRGRKQLRKVQDSFAALGFQIGPAGPVSFSISATREIFERAFKGTDFSKPLPAELALSTLPRKLTPLVDKIVFTSGYVPFAP